MAIKNTIDVEIGFCMWCYFSSLYVFCLHLHINSLSQIELGGITLIFQT
jgi:hypothetical protein